MEREAHYLDLLLEHQVNGIIAAATSQRWAALQEAALKYTPIVLIDRPFPDLQGACLGVDNERGAYIWTRYLIERGHQTIEILWLSMALHDV